MPAARVRHDRVGGRRPCARAEPIRRGARLIVMTPSPMQPAAPGLRLRTMVRPADHLWIGPGATARVPHRTDARWRVRPARTRQASRPRVGVALRRRRRAVGSGGGGRLEASRVSSRSPRRARGAGGASARGVRVEGDLLFRTARVPSIAATSPCTSRYGARRGCRASAASSFIAWCGRP